MNKSIITENCIQILTMSSLAEDGYIETKFMYLINGIKKTYEVRLLVDEFPKLLTNTKFDKETFIKKGCKITDVNDMKRVSEYLIEE